MNLSPNFTLEELTSSPTASKLRIDNTPDAAALSCLRRLVTDILQPVRDRWQKPIHVNSGYRCPKLNAAVGGVPSSQHRKGQAADITSSDNGALFRLMERMVKNGDITVGQLISEYGTRNNPKWIHVSIPASKKNQVLHIGN